MLFRTESTLTKNSWGRLWIPSLIAGLFVISGIIQADTWARHSRCALQFTSLL
jgi:hypothetical protein